LYYSYKGELSFIAIIQENARITGIFLKDKNGLTARQLK
jgi:hypothetical protein